MESNLQSRKIFEMMAKQDLSKFVEKVKGIFHFQIKEKKDSQAVTFTLDLKNDKGSVSEGAKGKADCTFVMMDKDVMLMTEGKLKPQTAFVQGKLKIKGDVKLAMKFTPDMLPKMPKL